MIDSPALLKDLKVQIKLLQADLRERADDTSDGWGARLEKEYAEARRRERTGHSWVAWRDNEVDQATVAWVVATTFLRFCEDNDLLAGAHLDGTPTPVGWIAGPENRTERAEENLTAYFRANPTHNRRHWLQQGFRVLAAQPAGTALVDPKYNPVWTAPISSESAAALIEFWRRTDISGMLVHDFSDPALGTRFLGDLYQDLSEHAKKTYALRQTPDFVEEFILDQTLTPALKEFGLDGLKLIDPTCGSGHFLLGAFGRLEQKWREEAPALNAKERARRAMDSLHGVDLNPFAVAIARFRLTVAGLESIGERSLVGVPALGFHLAIGDSLLGEGGKPAKLDVLGEDEDKTTYLYDTEDLEDYVGILRPGQYHVVMGNPPYVTAKDKAANAIYRQRYRSATGKYALSVPFMELFFRLAIRGGHGQGAGYVGQITSNSFMKREFGKTLIEEFIAGHHIGNPVDLTAVIDSSGAWIPGHNFDGTPTVILVGRRRLPVASTVRAVLGKKDDAGKLERPSEGPVWAEIASHLLEPGFDGEYVTVTDLDRSILNRHPWSLGGGGAADLKMLLDENKDRTVASVSKLLGVVGMTNADDVFLAPAEAFRRRHVESAILRRLVTGDALRNYLVLDGDTVLFPYIDKELIDISQFQGAYSWLWPARTETWNRATFDKLTYRREGRSWWEWHQIALNRVDGPVIAFAEVATHNHFVFDRGGRVFNRPAPIIKLPEGATEDLHLELLGILNSSTACFWLKQVAQKKGGDADVAWLRTYQYNCTKVGQIPLPATLPLERGRILDALARDIETFSPNAVISSWLESGGGLALLLRTAQGEVARLVERMVFEQEELDWEVYGLYGLVNDPASLVSSGPAGLEGGSNSCSPDDGNHSDDFDCQRRIALGERAFEIAFARQASTDEEASRWFDEHGSTPTSHLPETWLSAYREVVERRLNLIESDPYIGLLEKPNFKRRWELVTWADQLAGALKAAILDRLELPELWRDAQGPVAQSVAQLADRVRGDPVLQELVLMLTGDSEPDLVKVFSSFVSDEAVPYLAAHRYKPTGLEKFRIWQKVWALQRREDAGEEVDITVPPKYDPVDFRKAAFAKVRGKLDVPNERFILYPDLRREGDQTPVLGWAGWDHRDQALALGRELPVQEMLGVDDSALTPLIAGLVELEPWLHQWHHEDDPNFGASPAAVISQLIDQYLLRMEKTREQVTAWPPPAAARGRRPARS